MTCVFGCVHCRRAVSSCLSPVTLGSTTVSFGSSAVGTLALGAFSGSSGGTLRFRSAFNLSLDAVSSFAVQFEGPGTTYLTTTSGFSPTSLTVTSMQLEWTLTSTASLFMFVGANTNVVSANVSIDMRAIGYGLVCCLLLLAVARCLVPLCFVGGPFCLSGCFVVCCGVWWVARSASVFPTFRDVICSGAPLPVFRVRSNAVLNFGSISNCKAVLSGSDLTHGGFVGELYLGGYFDRASMNWSPPPLFDAFVNVATCASIASLTSLQDVSVLYGGPTPACLNAGGQATTAIGGVLTVNYDFNIFE
jgi:hypothetical protein